MNIEEFREYCLLKKCVTESFPFDKETLVFKVMGKMFALCGLEHHPFQVNLKCDPERSIALREEHEPSIMGAYHMSKKHWNSVVPNTSFTDKLFCELIDHSYELVVKGMTKKLRDELNALS
jgi:predicted DNA-binding protein (MmcQ/YjbR family)